jgi:hypothetical protein
MIMLAAGTDSFAVRHTFRVPGISAVPARRLRQAACSGSVLRLRQPVKQAVVRCGLA